MATIALYANKINQMHGLIKDVKKSVTDYKSELSALKTKSLTINKSVCNLDDIISSIQTSSQTQEEKIASLETFSKNNEQFITDTAGIDSEVADIIKKRKDDFYDQYYYLKPECEKSGWEKFKDGVKSVGEWCKEHWKIIVTIVLVIAAIVVIIVCPASAVLLLAIAKGILIGAAVGGVLGGTISALTGGSFWEGFEDGAFMGAISGAIGGGMGSVMSAGGTVALSLGQTLLIGGVSGAGSSLLGDLGDIFIKGDNISFGQVLLNMGISGGLGVLFSGIGYGIIKGFTALRLKVFKPSVNTSVSKYKPREMQIAEFPGVKYLDETERLAYRLNIKDGKLYNAAGELFDTSMNTTIFSGKGQAIYVMDLDGNIYAGTHIMRRFHHSSFLSGNPVSAAGEISVKNGVIESITRKSGHYFPEEEHLSQFVSELIENGIDLSKTYIGPGF